MNKKAPLFYLLVFTFAAMIFVPTVNAAHFNGYLGVCENEGARARDCVKFVDRGREYLRWICVKDAFGKIKWQPDIPSSGFCRDNQECVEQQPRQTGHIKCMPKETDTEQAPTNIFEKFSGIIKRAFTAPETESGIPETIEVFLTSVFKPSVFQETISVTIQLTPFEKPPQKEFLPFGKLQKPEAKKEAAKKFLSLGKLTKPEVKKVEPPKPVELRAAFEVIKREGFTQFKTDWNVKNTPAGAKVSTRIAEHHNFEGVPRAGSRIYTVGDGNFRPEWNVEDQSKKILACLSGPEEIVSASPGAGTFSEVTQITTPTPLANATEDTAYSVTLSVRGRPPLTWSISSGSLPTGLTLNATTGVISGTPAEGEAARSPFTFTVNVVAASGSHSKEVVIPVDDDGNTV